MKESKKKDETAAVGAAAEASTKLPAGSELEALRAEIRKEEEEKAMAKALQALGVDPATIAAEDAAAKKHRESINEILEYDIGPSVVTINGQAFSGQGRAPRHVVEVLTEVAGKRNRRILKEALGTQYEVVTLATGKISSKRVGSAPASSN